MLIGTSFSTDLFAAYSNPKVKSFHSAGTRWPFYPLIVIRSRRRCMKPHFSAKLEAMNTSMDNQTPLLLQDKSSWNCMLNIVYWSRFLPPVSMPPNLEHCKRVFRYCPPLMASYTHSHRNCSTIRSQIFPHKRCIFPNN